ncbi:MAG: serpin [Faunusvirus sp.]|jgi:serpin B|uniref:Serpin n=1 Tax=Faunusvirus sp. TaxID=2487766 RepID=A0A3G4ZXJ0_9VIRU|nr:MAG: serpin [Faunusvirus sp.]
MTEEKTKTVEVESSQSHPVEVDYDNYTNANGVDLYKQLVTVNKNFVISPYSIYLAMLYVTAGSNKETYRQLSKTLHITDIVKLIKQTEELYGHINKSSINITNTFYLANGFDITAGYKTFIDKIGRIENIDVSEAARENTVNAINKYISNSTNGLINEIIGRDDINVDVRMLLVNTIYFKSDWLHKFKVSNTHKQTFHGVSNRDIDIMYQRKKFNYTDDAKNQYIELDYADKNFCMGIMLSNDKTQIPKITSVDRLYGIINKMSSHEIDVYIPKFTHTSKIKLVDEFKKLGVTDLFDPIKSDLSIISDTENLYVSNILHECVVVIDESGTEAAAATAVMMSRESCVMRVKEPVVFMADHAFIYYIRHKTSNTILFMGKYV